MLNTEWFTALQKVVQQWMEVVAAWEWWEVCSEWDWEKMLVIKTIEMLPPNKAGTS